MLNRFSQKNLIWFKIKKLIKIFIVSFLFDRELLKHDKIVFNDNGTVSTEPKHPLVWDEELSMGHKENDTFLLPNIALLVSCFFFRNNKFNDQQKFCETKIANY